MGCGCNNKKKEKKQELVKQIKTSQKEVKKMTLVKIRRKILKK